MRDSSHGDENRKGCRWSSLREPFYMTGIKPSARKWLNSAVGRCRLIPFRGRRRTFEYAQRSGIFDVSHMGRFIIRGGDALRSFSMSCPTTLKPSILLRPGPSTRLSQVKRGGVDDAFLYRFVEGEYLLVVNAANRQKDWDHSRFMLGRSKASN